MVYIVEVRMKKGLKSTRDLNCGDIQGVFSVSLPELLKKGIKY